MRAALALIGFILPLAGGITLLVLRRRRGGVQVNTVAIELREQAVIRQRCAGNAGCTVRERRLRVVGVGNAGRTPVRRLMHLFVGRSRVTDGNVDAALRRLADEFFSAGQLRRHRDDAHCLNVAACQIKERLPFRIQKDLLPLPPCLLRR